MIPRRSTTLARLHDARALLGRVGVGAAERAGRDRPVEGRTRRRTPLRLGRFDPAMFFVAGPLVARFGARAVAYAAAAFAAATTLPGLDSLLPHARARARGGRRDVGDPRRRRERERRPDRAGHRPARDAARTRALLRRHPHRRGARGRRARRRRRTRADPARSLGLPRADGGRGRGRHRPGRDHELARHAARRDP